MLITYYAVKNNDPNDKNINILIELCFDLILPCIIWRPDVLIPIFYKFHNIENFIVSSLKFKGDEWIRKTVAHVFRLICHNYQINSSYSKVNNFNNII